MLPSLDALLSYINFPSNILYSKIKDTIQEVKNEFKGHKSNLMDATFEDKWSEYEKPLVKSWKFPTFILGLKYRVWEKDWKKRSWTFKRSWADDGHYKIQSLENMSKHIKFQVATTKTAFKIHDKNKKQFQNH